MERTLTQSQTPHLIIEPSPGWRMLDLHEIWQYRDLLLTLAIRDVKLRYRQTALGPVWVLLGPLLSAGLFSFIFGNIAKLPSDGVNYFLFVYAGQMAWNAFSGTLGKTQSSLVGNAHLVSKIYFPRFILPLSSLFSTLIDFGIALTLMVVFILVKGITLHAGIVLLPVWLFLLLLLSLGIGSITSALTVSYRDVGSFVGPVIQLLQWASGVVLAASALPAVVRPYYYLNPIASLIEGFRWSLLGTNPPPGGYVAYAVMVTFIVFLGGILAFKRMERRFADVI